MPLNGYGLLIGRVTASRKQRRGSAHWLLMVQPGDARHPPYRVAVNLESTEYQSVEFGGRATAAGRTLAQKLRKMGPTPSFLVASANPDLPRLDFVRGGIIDPEKFPQNAARAGSLLSLFQKMLAQDGGHDGIGALVAVFGTGYPIDPTSGKSMPTGFTGVDNIHMNQGAMNLVNSPAHYVENGPEQDGGIIFLAPSGDARGLFVKFATQTVQTDEDGNPTVTGIPQLDRTPAKIREAIMPRIPTAEPKTGYVFADVNPADASGTYIPDDDAGTYKTPFVMTQSTGHTRGPVPTPTRYPRMDLSDVVGNNPPGYRKDKSGTSLAFDFLGDSGATTQTKLDAFELKVTDLLARDAQASPPAFLFHVGDVVYFYGEEDYYYSQFYEPFRAYPAPIFAIPGNHDGITYKPTMVSLDSFQKAFCAPAPARWAGSAGILRTSMTQPGVYFTLDTPLLSIIGLYSNCGESFGWLNDQQLLFLYQELTRLKALRSKGGLPAVILAIHHFPRWFPTQKPKDPNSTAIDATCQKAGFWPDAVICGHAHLYQRVVRQDAGGKDIPYVMAGAGGYGIAPQEQVGKPYMQQIASSGLRLSRVLNESGYVRTTVTDPASGDATLRFEYHSVKQTSNEPDDVCTVSLREGKLV